MVQTFLRNVWKGFKLPMSASATVARKSFNAIFVAKVDFPFRHFMLPFLMLTLEVHTLFDKYLDHKLVKFQQNRMVQTIQNFVLFDKKYLTIFDSVDAILEDVSVTKTIVRCQIIDLKTFICQCSKNYGSPTRVTRLKVAPNMVDAISLNENLVYS